MMILIAILLLQQMHAQNGLLNTGQSPYAKLNSIGLGDVQWTNGFWADRFAVCRNATLPHLWNVYTSKDSCFSFENFRIAAGLDTGDFRGPSFHDGDFYKLLEAAAAVYANTKDPALDAQMDAVINVIGKAQRFDGYIYTKSIIEQKKNGQSKMFDDKLSFEAYNFGHLMTAACVHYRATGKTSLLDIARKAADFLIEFYNHATPEQARNAVCPSHYMGITELYRTTGDKKYLALVKKLIDIRGTVEGTDDNSDRQPVRDMQGVVGHAVRANYLFAGVADVYAETGDASLLKTLDKVWDDVTNHKMYVTGGCGALYDGVSVDGTSYKPDTVQKIHQAYGRDYQLPNFSAHNETCANIGNVLWNWRMLQITGDARFADIAELALYNSVLSGVSMSGTKFFYTNPLAATADYPYHLRWEGGRQSYIALSDCCPPNEVRTVAEVSNYLYSVAEDGLYLNLYGSNKLNTKLKDGAAIRLEEITDYPWNGAIGVRIKEVPEKPFTIYLRIPGWCQSYSVKINGVVQKNTSLKQGYAICQQAWKPGDVISLNLAMPATLIESNPLVEETKNQVTVKRGPIVYCLESPDLPGKNIFDVVLPASVKLLPQSEKISGGTVMTLSGEAEMKAHTDWHNTLYKPVSNKKTPVKIKLIPYYAWANRGKSDMTVWMPVR
ncbi:MAG: glycoside hydrolase family 127 protein [Chitinophagaceae bacterium]